MIKVSLLTLSLFVATLAQAVEPGEVLEDPALEARARVISQDLRCVVCQNETIDESNATLAQDMRRLVRQRINAGDTNEQVVAYMVDRYGDFVLLRPRVTPQTWLLWFGPILILVLGGVVVVRVMKRPASNVGEALSQEELDRLDSLLPEDNETS
ncbi:MAG: cytochrome c-type biogenesis protein CcmH [Rhodospirillaceae bacterium]|jgi:cytochrome c-type biogenesis protein CcmH|nr:cytochrome c-type biogenesis protein CcmH [Rhodospirillaceae bacterium]|tara:strand:+ start:4281 stop:4745 length:465 start_codon:yes stop_codon:yes gene_type:complete